MNYYKQHQDLLKKFKLFMQEKFPDARFRDNITGMFYTKNGTPVKVNKPGTPDTELRMATTRGIVIFEFEIKSGKSRQSKIQKTWQANTESMNGFYCIVREDFEEVLQSVLDYIDLNNIDLSISNSIGN